MSKILTKSLIGSTDVSFMDAPLVSVPNTAIVNRAQIRDLSKDMAPLFGVRRFPTQQIFELPHEFGSAGERVWGVINDERGQFRFVGSWSNYSNLQYGTPIASSLTTDYVEITFYGTGLNMLTISDGNARDIRASIDGGAEGSNLMPNTFSVSNAARFYASNQIVPIVNGLTLGTHTIKLRNNSANNLYAYGFEFLSELSSITVNPGSFIKDQKRLTLDVATSVALKPAALTGARGGRVVVYNTGSAIATAVTPTNTAQAVFASADHTNEEIIRTIYVREFGQGRTDDFSTLTGSGASTRAFTLEDGTTALAANARINQFVTGQPEGLNIDSGGAGEPIYLTFVGTGLDVAYAHDSSTPTDVYTFAVDNTSIGTFTPAVASEVKILKVISGLPYGTHIVKITKNSVAPDMAFTKFIVYGPKKPTIPTSAVEIADYFVMATYVATTTPALESMAPGVLRKSPIRELSMVGTWTSGLGISNYPSGTFAQSGATGAFFEYTFFGTGFEYRFYTDPSYQGSVTVLIDGVAATSSNFPAAAFSVTSPATYNTTTGILAQNVTNGPGRALSINGLALGKHTVRFTAGSAAPIDVSAFDIITPIHGQKPTLYADYQNTLPLGSLALSDSRPVTNKAATAKVRAIATDLGTDSSTTSSVMVPMLDMSLTVTSTGDWYEFELQCVVQPSGAASNQIETQFYVDGSPVGKRTYTRPLSATTVPFITINPNHLMWLPAGTHKIDAYWLADGNSVTVLGGVQGRQLTVKQL